jgi:hypothetical protein
VTRHRFDLIAAALGVIAVTIGLVVATGAVDSMDAGDGWWFAVGALVLGIALIPWSRRADGVAAPGETVPGETAAPEGAAPGETPDSEPAID